MTAPRLLHGPGRRAILLGALLLGTLGGAPARADGFGAALAAHLRGDAADTALRMQALAEAGDPDALLFLAEEAQRRLLPDEDATPATELYARAAAQGSVQAQARLGDIYRQRAADATDDADRSALHQVARHWYGQAAEAGHPGAAFALAGLMAQGAGGPADAAAALALYQRAAEAGHPGADRQLGLMLIAQDDFAGAAVWIRAAAEAGDAAAQAIMADLHRLGLGVAQDDALSLDWLARAAEAGNEGAQHDLALRYWSGLGVPEDRARALSLLRAAADGGNLLARLDLGLMHYRGFGVPQDYGLALDHFAAAAAAGSAEGQFRMGQMVEIGRGPEALGTAANQRGAIDWYMAAADQGHVPAQMALARLYDTGHISLRNPERALSWYRAAAEAGDPAAAAAVATMLAEGRGVPRFDDGPATHFGHLPDVLFVTGSFAPGDGARVAAAIDRFAPEVIVLHSPGGIVAEAIAVADLIHARGLSTYVPPRGNCLSACVYVFAAGAARLAAGHLGVHQLQAAQADATVPIGDVQAIISQILAALNRYAVPPFVIERILSSSVIQLLTPEEREQLARGGDGLMAQFDVDLVQSVFDNRFR